MADWSELMKPEKRSERGRFSTSLLTAMEPDCLTRKPRDPLKRDLMRQLGLPERYPEVQYPSPGNTPPDLDDEDI
jgi:hypothetical protein